MKIIVSPYAQGNTGVAIFNVDVDTSRLIASHKRFVMEPLQREQSGLADGVIHSDFTLAGSEMMRPFFACSEVSEAAGGLDGLKAWLNRSFGCCQAPDGGDHDNKFAITAYGESAVKLCWYHDNHYMLRTREDLSNVLHMNRVNWILETIATELRLPYGKDISVIEVCWWAIGRGLAHLLPADAGRIALCREKEPVPAGTLKESDIVWSASDGQLLQKYEGEIARIGVEEDSGLLYMRRPKLLTGRSVSYRRFVSSRPCEGCGGAVATPYLYRHRSLREHDRYLVPLCDKCSREADADIKGWEQKQGKKLYLIANKLFDFAIEHGVIKFEN
jgi:hypothetical protein